ncbi:helix-turn-helix domain-containing protein [Micromonospora sp. CPCC 205711]|uniref:TetR/AcrR family transcriptional regulator n=1 Tax=Micromonospora sp. CPCC 205547 TaxID=3122400 RepID=UPI002FEFE6AE
MSELPQERRRRADAERSVAAVLDAATDLLGRRPEASMEEIATHAGVARQTVYAHFRSRRALLRALVGRMTAEATDAIDAADLDSGSAATALLRWVDVSWGLMSRYPVLLTPVLAAEGPEEEHERHMPIIERLDRLVRRGQASGDFDPQSSPTWLVAAVIGLGHAAGEEVRAGRMSTPDAGAAFRESVRRVCAAEPPGRQD